ncbi:single-stranded-DNA-specific exonuclease RecJ [Patescibacteria group bacterium]|nr:single-stranded-DNA-specific exonuclease RecJ [Patescibacteria group bacterium]
MDRKWIVAKKITEEFKHQFPEINPIILQLFYNRGLKSQEAIDEFTNPDYGRDVHDPFLFRDMKKAVARIFKAIENKELITIHGDYDADGVSATVILVSIFKALDMKVDVYIPHRMSEGYGLNKNTVEELSNKGTKLIITVDCGISNKAEVELATKLGIDVIITDHHEEPPKLPRAIALINPSMSEEKYPFKKLSGTGVAFKLAQAIVKHDGGKKLKEGIEKWLLDVVAIGTIADMVPLTGENRTLVKYGLKVLHKTRRRGIRELVNTTHLKLETLDSNGVAFGIVPRLNAAGRVDHANTAYELLMVEGVEESKKAAEGLEKNNKLRQKMTEKMVYESKKQIGEVGERKILFAMKEEWSAGLVGLVAGRLSDFYNRPVLIMGVREGEVIGSGRSIPAFDITAALVKSSEYLNRYGGHAAACGFTVKAGQLDQFKDKMAGLADQLIKDDNMQPRLPIDGEAKLSDIGWDLVKQLDDFEPFGMGNSQVYFVTYGLAVEDLQKVGNDGKHLRLMVKQGEATKKIIAFGFGRTWGNQLKIGDMIDAVYEVSVNEWNGRRELQLKLVDLKLSA